jgi:glycosyltransferase involved in cell wall biosynthesis
MTMKICFISNSVTMFTGFGQQTRLLSKKFAELGHEVFNLCEKRLDEETPWITEIAFNKFSIPSTDRELSKIKPDVVIVLDGYNRNFDCPNLSYSGRCKFFFWFPYESIIPLSSHTKLFKNVPDNRVVFTSKFTQDIWSPHVKGPVIYHCVDTDLLSAKPDKVNANKLIRKLGIPTDKSLICNVNRNEMRKRWDDFYEVFQSIRNKEPGKYHAVVHSNDAGFYDFQDLEEYYGLGDEVTRTGFEFTKGLSKEDFRDLFSQMNLRLDTASSEGFGLNVAEFAVMGVPQWVGNHTCMSEILGEDYPKFPCNGIFVSHYKNIYSTVDYSEPLVITREHVLTAQKRAIELFNPDEIARQWLDLINNTEVSPKHKWGFNPTERMGADFMNAAGLCQKIGGDIIEYGTHDGRFVECCLYHGLNIKSLNTEILPVSDRVKDYCIPLSDLNAVKKTPQANIAVITDYTVPPTLLLGYNWLLIRRELVNQEIPVGFHRRLELESAMVSRYRFFSHEIYAKDPYANPLI